MNWLELLTQNPVPIYVMAVLFGLIIGSFLNVVILRLPRIIEEEWRSQCEEFLDTPGRKTTQPHGKKLSLSHPPSTCPGCGHRIRAYENIPVISYLFLRGRCSSCHHKISIRYPLIEIFTAILTLLVVIQFGVSWQTPFALLFTWMLIALAIIDFDTQLLPDKLTLPLLWIGLLLSLSGLFTDPASAIIGAVSGYLSLWIVFQLFRLLTGKEGMGYGDFKLLAAFGAWLGWQFLPQIVLLSALTGSVLGVLIILTGLQHRETPMPFGPFLAAACWISLMWGREINATYLHMTGLS